MKERLSELEDFIVEFMKDKVIPGLSISIRKGGKVIYENGFGLRDIHRNKEVNPDTIFGTASVSKSFACLGILLLEQEGKLSVQDSVTNYLPELNDPLFKHVKIFHLLSHSSGLPSLIRNEELNSFSSHVKYFNSVQHEPFGKPGEYFSYNNDTFLLVGAIIEKVTGKLFRRFMTEELLNKLDMYRSTYSLEEIEKYTNVSIPYEFDKNTKEHITTYYSKLGNYEVGGGVRSTVRDLSKYGSIFVESSNPLIDSERLNKMYNPTIQVGRNDYYGYGFKVTPEYSGVTLVEHGGDQPGVSSHFGFIPEEKITIAVLTNLTGVRISKIWLAAANCLLGLPIDTPRVIEPHYKSSSNELQKFCGTYKGNEGEIKIIMESSNLYLQSEDEKYQLRMSDPQTLVITEEEIPLKFYFQDNAPWGVLFGVRILRRTS